MMTLSAGEHFCKNEKKKDVTLDNGYIGFVDNEHIDEIVDL